MQSTATFGRKDGRRVLITGASSGIGEAIARLLSSEGFVVYAGVRRASDFERLKTLGPGVLPVRLDVTDDCSVADAIAEIVHRQRDCIDILINNAGIALAGPLELLEPKCWQEQMEVNVVGLARVTRACLPSLRRARGAIINIGSAAADLSLPMLGPYAASKRAVEALTDSLRREVGPLGVRVILIHPGQTATPIYQKSEARTEEAFRQLEDYEEPSYYQVLKNLQSRMHGRSELRGRPERVAKVVLKSLSVRFPKTVYRVGWDAWGASFVDCWIPKQLVDWLLARQLRS